jgi:hypothetical protein
LWAMRCVQCGDIIDETIFRNRHFPHYMLQEDLLRAKGGGDPSLLDDASPNGHGICRIALPYAWLGKKIGATDHLSEALSTNRRTHRSCGYDRGKCQSRYKTPPNRESLDG